MVLQGLVSELMLLATILLLLVIARVQSVSDLFLFYELCLIKEALIHMWSHEVPN
jgi:hypothetical protein